MRPSDHFEDCVSVSNKSSESVDSVLFDPTYEHNVQSNYASECGSPPASSSGAHLSSDDADSMLSGSKLGPQSPPVSIAKMYSISANNSPFLGRKNLVSENGSIIWDSDGDWIQLYDKMLRMTSCQQRQRACGCMVKRSSEVPYQSVYASPQHLRRGTVSLVFTVWSNVCEPFCVVCFCIYAVCTPVHFFHLFPSKLNSTILAPVSCSTRVGAASLLTIFWSRDAA